jgi:hypothetical protein
MRHADKRHLQIWTISLLSLAFFAILANVWFNDIPVAKVSWYARVAYKLLGTLWLLLVLGITSVIFGSLSFWRRGFLGLLFMILIVLFIWVAQSYVLVSITGDALQPELENAESYYLKRVLVVSKNTLLFSLVIFSIALWLSERIWAKIADRSSKKGDWGHPLKGTCQEKRVSHSKT